MSFCDHAFVIIFVFYSLSGVLSQIDIFPKPTAVVNVGDDLIFTCTRTSSTWNSFVYFINGLSCFLTFAMTFPCRAAVTSCNTLQSYSYSCDKIYFNLTISNVQRLMQNTSVGGALALDNSYIMLTDEVTIQVNVPLRNITLDPSGLLTLVEGETRQVTCSAVSIPPATLSWSLDGSTLPNTLPNVVDDDTVISTKRYTARKQDNSKTITCTASYESMVYMDDVTLSIAYLPHVQITPSEHDPYKVIENTTDLQLMCSVTDSNPGVTSYRWYKDGSIMTTTTAYYTMSTVRRLDSGGYSCDATNTVGTSPMSSVLRLDVQYGIILDDHVRQAVNEGLKLDVTCTGQSNPPITDNNVRWTKQNDNTFTQRGRQLTIANVSRANTGIYICTVDITMTPSIGPNVQKSATVALEVDVLYIPIVQVIPSQYSPYKMIENTTNLQLMCSVIDTNPAVTSYRWHKDGFIIPTTSANYTISYLKRSNAGDYSCDATNSVGTSNRTPVVNLDVLYGITLDDLRRKDVNSGSKLDVTCTGQSNPPITDDNVKWTKQDNITFVRTGRQLLITNVNRADKGKYICTVDITLTPSIGTNVLNSATVSFEVNVLYTPIVRVEPTQYNPYKIIENTTNVQFRCFVIDTNPDVISYRWYKNGSILPTNTSDYTISIVRRSHTGDYSCDATNIIGISNTPPNVKLDVLYGVTMNTIQDQQVKENTSLVILNCTGDSNPVVKDGNVSWIKQGNATFSSNGKLLIIKNVNRFDTGKYVCNVSLSLIPSVGETAVVSDSIDVSVDVLCNTRLDTSNDLPNTIGIKTNEELNITIYLIGNPKPDILWSFRTSDTGQSTTLSNVVVKSLGFHLYVTHYTKTSVLTSDFGFYTIEASNMNETAFRHSLEVKQAREPYNPSNIVVVCDITSMIAVWQSEFNGGSAQTFYVIWISLDTNVTSRSVGILDPGQGNFEHFKTKSLEPNANYRIYIESSNEYGRSRSNAISNCTTSTDPADICDPRDEDSLSFSAGIGVGLVLVVLCESTILGIICMIKRKQSNLPEKTKIYESTKNKAGPANTYSELNEKTQDEQNELTTRHNNTDTPNMYDDVMLYDNQVARSEGKKGLAKGSTETQIVGGIYMNTEI